MHLTSTATPEFLVWALEFACPVRGFQDGTDPGRTERQLRAARAVTDARKAGHVFEGWCLDPPYGFRIDDALAIYGGIAAVECQCLGCPANALGRREAQALAGCFGMAPLPADPSLLHAAIDEAIVRLALAADVERLFPITRPQWYGLWIGGILAPEQQAVLARLLSAITIDDPVCRVAMTELAAGLVTGADRGLPMHVRLYPPGRVEGTWWKLVDHCPRCNAPWPAERSRQCRVCDDAGHPAPQVKRKARGKRPYFPLERLMTPAALTALLDRYAACQARSAPQDPASGRHPAMPPDNPPAG